jgi:hypothetical protein
MVSALLLKENATDGEGRMLLNNVVEYQQSVPETCSFIQNPESNMAESPKHV